MVDYTEIQWRLNGIVDDLENGYILTECPNCGIAPSSEGCMCNDVPAHRMTARAYLKSFKAEYSRDETTGKIKVTLDDGDGYKFELDTQEKSVTYNRPWHIVKSDYSKDAMNIATEIRKEWEKKSD
tara:strand:+ start:230 stop:607 length:378 start_codon:yes stop_codon:yes gene_type:complete